MKAFKNLKSYKKPSLKKYGNIKSITKGGWQTSDNDGIANRYSDS